MVTVNFKLDKNSERGYYVNLSNGWTRKVEGDEVYKLLIFYCTSFEYRVFIDEVTEGMLNQAVKLVSAESYTPEQIVQNLKNFQFNKYLCSILKQVEK